MTALAVVGLACALIVAGDDAPPDWPDLRAAVNNLNARNASLRAAVDSLEAELDIKEIGFRPCWPGEAPGDPIYYFTYNVTVRGGRFGFAPHQHWAVGTELRDTIAPPLMSVLEGFPRGEVTGEDMVSFGERVSDAVQAADHPVDCRLAVTVNTDVTGDEINYLTRTVFYPVWR